MHAQNMGVDAAYAHNRQWRLTRAWCALTRLLLLLLPCCLVLPAVLLGMQTHPALPQPAGQPAEHVPQLVAAGAAPPSAAAAANAPTYESARDIMDGSGAFAPTFDSEHRVLRLSAKLFNVTPADLPPDVRGVLTGWLASAPAAVEGYIRPGCVLLNLHMTVGKRWVGGL